MNAKSGSVHRLIECLIRMPHNICYAYNAMHMMMILWCVQRIEYCSVVPDQFRLISFDCCALHKQGIQKSFWLKNPPLKGFCCRYLSNGVDILSSNN